FLLPTLQIRDVLQATTIRDRYEALKTLPLDLDEAFDGTMRRIEQQPGALSNKAARIIVWIHLAERPLTVDELLCSLLIKDGDKSLDPNGIPIRKSLVNCCQGLALIDQETSTVRLVHYSLEEYLIRQDKIFGHTKVEWHSKIATTCLTFLNFPSRGTEESGETMALLVYAATQWGHHIRRADDSPDMLLDLAIEYLYHGLANNPEHLRLLGRVMFGFYDMENISNDVLHTAAFFGSPWSGHDVVVKLLLDTGKVDPDLKDKYGWTPLSRAAWNGHKAVVKLLLDTGKVDANLEDKNGWTPLFRAAENGHGEVVKLLQSFIDT
ncbi:ankyrin, partial [Amniculicola lignicola CBS 123094]